MVRVPQWWAGKVTSPAQGLWTPGSSVAARRVDVTPLSAYRNPVDVDLGNDGIAPQALFGGDAGHSGTRTSPPAPFSLIFTGAVLTAGTYTVTWTVTLSGTLGAGDANNFILNLGPSIFLAASVNAGSAGSYPQASVTFTTTGGLSLLLLSGAGAATSGAVYGGSLSTGGTAIAQVGPSGWGQSWALDQASLSTSVGVLDPAQCALFVGPLAIPFYQVVSGLAGGGSQFGLGGVGLAQGWFVTAVWTGGTVGAFAYLRVTGVKTALTQ